MRFTQIILLGIFLFATTQAFAHEHRHRNPCKAYVANCEKDPSVTGATDDEAKNAATKACILKAAKADTENGQKCVDAQTDK